MIKLRKLLYIYICILSLGSAYAAEQEPIARTIIALYSTKTDGSQSRSRIHLMAEMPLNHLGLKLEYHDIDKAIPPTNIATRKDILGVLTWFETGMDLKDPKAYLEWAGKVVDAGKRYVILEGPGFYQSEKGEITPNYTVNRFLRKIGIRDEQDWIDFTYDSKYKYKDPAMVEFERRYKKAPPSYNRISTIKGKATSHLIIEKEDEIDRNSSLIVTSDNGGYAAEEIVLFNLIEYVDGKEVVIRQWYINPFEFFRTVFATDSIPKPDTTTIAGRRIYYSHIDGDGWNNISNVDQYVSKDKIASWVIMQEAIKKYPDLPVTVAPIAADIDPEWAAIDASIATAKELLALDNVEAGSHTYSHPFFWGFFADGDFEKERPFLPYYHFGSWDKRSKFMRILDVFFRRELSENKDIKAIEGIADYGYQVPRGFANKPYSSKLEISGSIKAIEKLLPQDKKVKILMWSGNTRPYEEVLRLTRQAGVRNINGGDTRFDREYASVGWVSPIGRQVGKERQIYASNSNENTYTDLWTGRYYGFKYLVSTIKNTEMPMRLKPFNVYYHMYSGEKQASLYALLDNLNYARTQNLSPITASNFAGISEGFFSTQIIPQGDKQWQINNRDELQTIRFDHAIYKTVDIEKSQGVIGFLHYQGSLYVYLDASNTSPIIATKPHPEFYTYPIASKPYLEQSRWPIRELTQDGSSTKFIAQGFGPGAMVWIMPRNGNYTISINGKPHATVKSINNKLSFTLPQATNVKQVIEIN